MHVSPRLPSPGATKPGRTLSRLAAVARIAAGLTGLGCLAFALRSSAGVVVGVIGLLLVVAALLSQAWASARKQLSERVTELSTVEEIGRAIAIAGFDVDAVCQLLYEHASRVVDTTIFHLGLFEGDAYAMKQWMRAGVREPQRSFQMSPGVGLVNWMRDSRQPLLVRDFQKEMDRLPARPAYIADEPPRSALFVPLMAGEAVIGTVSVQSFRRGAYGRSNLRALSALANQAAVAIQKAQLYEQERRRARQLDTIGQVARRVSATVEMEELFPQAVRLIRESFGYYHVGIFTADPEEQSVRFQTSASAGESNVAFAVDWGYGLIGWAAAHSESVIANDVAADPRYRPVDALAETRSELVVPLCLESQLVGLLDVQSERSNAFTADDLFILETLGAQVATAIQVARTYEAEKQQAWLSTALVQVADALSHLSDMDEVLVTIVRLTPMLSGVSRCAILLWDPESESFVPAQSYGLSPELRQRLEGLTLTQETVPALGILRSEQSPLVLSASQDHSGLPADLVEAFGIGEMVMLPLVAQGELLGAMLVDYAGEGKPVSERMLALLTGIANQSAMVVQGARLLRSQQEEAYASLALLQVADAVSRSASLSEALASVVRITPLLVGVQACGLFVRNPDGGAFLPVEQFGFARESQAVFWELRLPPDGPPARELLAGQPHVILQDLPGGADAASSWSEGRLLVLPIATRGETIGLMAVDYTGPAHRLTGRSISILAGIAGQTAIALENDRLMRESAEQERMKQELEVAKRIQISFLPECCPDVAGWELGSIWRSAREVAGDFYDFIPISTARGEPASASRTGIVIADVADKGVPAALFMALSRTLMRTMAISGRSASSAVGQANNLILADARAELFVTLFYMILRSDSGQVVYCNAGHQPPLVVRCSDGSAEELGRHGMALGVLPDQEYEEGTLELAHGDVIVLYTDGIVEACDAEGRMFGRRRLADAVRQHRGEPAADLAHSIDQAIAAFVGDAPQVDDLTLVIAKRSAPALLADGPVPGSGPAAHR